MNLYHTGLYASSTRWVTPWIAPSGIFKDCKATATNVRAIANCREIECA